MGRKSISKQRTKKKYKKKDRKVTPNNRTRKKKHRSRKKKSIKKGGGLGVLATGVGVGLAATAISAVASMAYKSFRLVGKADKDIILRLLQQPYISVSPKVVVTETKDFINHYLQCITTIEFFNIILSNPKYLKSRTIQSLVKKSVKDEKYTLNKLKSDLDRDKGYDEDLQSLQDLVSELNYQDNEDKFIKNLKLNSAALETSANRDIQELSNLLLITAKIPGSGLDDIDIDNMIESNETNQLRKQELTRLKDLGMISPYLSVTVFKWQEVIITGLYDETFTHAVDEILEERGANKILGINERKRLQQHMLELQDNIEFNECIRAKMIECASKPRGYLDYVSSKISWDSQTKCLSCPSRDCLLYIYDFYYKFLNESNTNIEMIDKVYILIMCEARICVLSKCIGLEAIRIQDKKDDRVRQIIEKLYLSDKQFNLLNEQPSSGWLGIGGGKKQRGGSGLEDIPGSSSTGVTNNPSSIKGAPKESETSSSISSKEPSIGAPEEPVFSLFDPLPAPERTEGVLGGDATKPKVVTGNSTSPPSVDKPPVEKGTSGVTRDNSLLAREDSTGKTSVDKPIVEKGASVDKPPVEKGTSGVARDDSLLAREDSTGATPENVTSSPPSPPIPNTYPLTQPIPPADGSSDAISADPSSEDTGGTSSNMADLSGTDKSVEGGTGDSDGGAEEVPTEETEDDVTTEMKDILKVYLSTTEKNKEDETIVYNMYVDNYFKIIHPAMKEYSSEDHIVRNSAFRRLQYEYRKKVWIMDWCTPEFFSRRVFGTGLSEGEDYISELINIVQGLFNQRNNDNDDHIRMIIILLTLPNIQAHPEIFKSIFSKFEDSIIKRYLLKEALILILGFGTPYTEIHADNLNRFSIFFNHLDDEDKLLITDTLKSKLSAEEQRSFIFPENTEATEAGRILSEYKKDMSEYEDVDISGNSQCKEISNRIETLLKNRDPIQMDLNTILLLDKCRQRKTRDKMEYDILDDILSKTEERISESEESKEKKQIEDIKSQVIETDVDDFIQNLKKETEQSTDNEKTNESLNISGKDLETSDQGLIPKDTVTTDSIQDSDKKIDNESIIGNIDSKESMSPLDEKSDMNLGQNIDGPFPVDLSDNSSIGMKLFTDENTSLSTDDVTPQTNPQGDPEITLPPDKLTDSVSGNMDEAMGDNKIPASETSELAKSDLPLNSVDPLSSAGKNISPEPLLSDNVTNGTYKDISFPTTPAPTTPAPTTPAPTTPAPTTPDPPTLDATHESSN